MLFNKSRADEILSGEGIDVVVATSRENVEYISGHRNPTHELMRNSLNFALYAPASAQQGCSIIPRLEVETFLASKSWIEDVYLIGMFNRPPALSADIDDLGRAVRAFIAKASSAASSIDALHTALEKRGLLKGRIAIDETGITPQVWAAIAQRLPNARIVPAGNLLLNIRMIKTAAEIERLRQSSRITERAVARALRSLREGTTDRDLQREFYIGVVEEGALPSFAMFASGSATGQPHLLTANRRISRGDLIRWDVGCTFESYYSDTARAVCFGEPTANQMRIWDLLSSGVEAALDLVKPGADPADLYRAAIGPLSRSGLPEYQRFHCGHAIGISIYDPPIMTQDDPNTSVFRLPVVAEGLRPGMVMNIEVAYYMPGDEGFLCEDTFLVTDGGCERFTFASKELRLEDYLSASNA